MVIGTLCKSSSILKFITNINKVFLKNYFRVIDGIFRVLITSPRIRAHSLNIFKLQLLGQIILNPL